MNKFKQILVGLGLIVFLFMPASVFAGESIFDTAKGTLKTASGEAGLGDPSEQNPSVIIGNIITTAIGILGVIAVILFIYAGGLWLTAGGTEDKVTQAKKIMTRTVIGMIIIGLAYGITTFVLNLVLA